MAFFRRALLAAATSRPASLMLRVLVPSAVTILMLHRFRDPERGSDGHDPALLRALLARLRRERYALFPLEELFRRLACRDPLPARTVVFTLDDGYADQAEIGAPVFADYDCPATVFLTTGFLDAAQWMWWDRIEFVLTSTPRSVLTLETPAGRRTYGVASPGECAAAGAELTRLCKTVREDQKQALMSALEAAGEVEVPSTPPARYAPMTWSDARRLESRGMTFGPHTVTHPILARTADRQSRSEIVASWERLQSELRAPVRVFCYPNGEPGDFGEREMGILQELGFAGAVTAAPHHVMRQPSGPPEHQYAVPRFAYADSAAVVLQVVSGVEQIKRRIRRAT